MRVLIIVVVFIFSAGEPLLAQSRYPNSQDTIPANSWEVDDFGESLEQLQKKIIIVSQDEVQPEAYDAPIEARIITEKKLEVINENAILRPLPKDYTGFKVQIAKSIEEPLAEDDEIFFRHGNIMVDKTGDGTFTYLIGNFSSEEQAQEFLDRFLLSRYSEARVIKYESGRRLY